MKFAGSIDIVGVEMKFVKACFALLLVSSVSLASGAATGVVTGYIPTAAGATEFFLVSTQTTIGTTPPCNITSRFALSAVDKKYKAVLASIVAAYHAGTPVYIVGAGTCNVWGNAEDISYVCFGSVPC